MVMMYTYSHTVSTTSLPGSRAVYIIYMQHYTHISGDHTLLRIVLYHQQQAKLQQSEAEEQSVAPCIPKVMGLELCIMERTSHNRHLVTL